MQRLLNILMEPLPGPTRIKPVQWMLFALLLLAAGSIRLYKLDAVPPGLWYDEALYSLDGLGFSQGNILLFYDEHGHPREPLYVWSLGTAFKIFGAETLVARSVSAAWGIFTVGAFFFSREAYAGK